MNVPSSYRFPLAPFILVLVSVVGLTIAWPEPLIWLNSPDLLSNFASQT